MTKRIDREAYLSAKFYEYIMTQVENANPFTIRLWPYDFVRKCRSEAILWYGLKEAIRYQRNVT